MDFTRYPRCIKMYTQNSHKAVFALSSRSRQSPLGAHNMVEISAVIENTSSMSIIHQLSTVQHGLPGKHGLLTKQVGHRMMVVWSICFVFVL